MIQTTKDEFIALYQDRVVLSNSKTLPDLKQEIVETQRRLFRLIRRAKKLEETGATSIDDPGKEYDRIMAIPQVDGIELRRSSMIVHLKTLYATNPFTGLRHELGRFRLDIYLNAPYINWVNTTRVVTPLGYPALMAPHIFAETAQTGRPCLGNMDGVFPALQASGEFAALITMAIEFIETVNAADSLGQAITAWPLADFHPDGRPKKRK